MCVFIYIKYSPTYLHVPTVCTGVTHSFFPTYACIHRPIHDAVEAGDLVMVKTLVHHGADITPDSGERYPVDIAKTKGYDAIVEYLQC